MSEAIPAKQATNEIIIRKIDLEFSLDKSVMALARGVSITNKRKSGNKEKSTEWMGLDGWGRRFKIFKVGRSQRFDRRRVVAGRFRDCGRWFFFGIRSGAGSSD